MTPKVPDYLMHLTPEYRVALLEAFSLGLVRGQGSVHQTTETILVDVKETVRGLRPGGVDVVVLARQMDRLAGEVRSVARILERWEHDRGRDQEP